MSKLNMYLTRQAPMPVRTFVQSTRIRSKARAFGSLGNCPSKPAPFGREFKALSQNGEDGLLYQIFETIGVTNKLFCEFGFSINECNSVLLVQNCGFSGLWIDGDSNNCCSAQAVAHRLGWKGVDIVNAFITTETINDLLRPIARRDTGEIDLLSIDIDGNDYWVLDRIDVLRARVLVLEYNGVFGPDRSVTIPYKADFTRVDYPGVCPVGDTSTYSYFGGSLTALSKLAAAKGYRLIGTDCSGTNAFYLHESVNGAVFPTVTPVETFRPQAYWTNQGKSMDDIYSTIADFPLVEV